MNFCCKVASLAYTFYIREMIIALVNHGCPKNLVDFEYMMTALSKAGYEVTLDVDAAELVIVNTCAFIHDAEKESVRTILEIVNMGKKVIVTGCLAQKYKDELKKSIPELAALVGISDFNNIVEVVKKVTSDNDFANFVSPEPCFKFPTVKGRSLTTMGASAYLKIADGCDCSCGYCIIPKLRGKQVSRTIEDILDEAKYLISLGIVEIILIAQDTTAYGLDNYKKRMLSDLIKKLNELDGLRWIRIMYAYPSNVTDELLFAIRDCKKVVKYLDLPLQHYDKDVLKLMKRPVLNYDKLIEKIRRTVPNIALRTTFIVGYPQETDEQFESLMNFVKRAKFEHAGVFKFCREKGTYAYTLKGQISSKIKNERYNMLMVIQKQISAIINKNRINDTIECIIEEIYDDGTIVMRSQYDAPEIDGNVYSDYNSGKGHDVSPADIVEVKISDADEYDLNGVITEIL